MNRGPDLRYNDDVKCHMNWIQYSIEKAVNIIAIIGPKNGQKLLLFCYKELNFYSLKEYLNKSI